MNGVKKWFRPCEPLIGVELAVSAPVGGECSASLLDGGAAESVTGDFSTFFPVSTDLFFARLEGFRLSRIPQALHTRMRRPFTTRDPRRHFGVVDVPHSKHTFGSRVRLLDDERELLAICRRAAGTFLFCKGSGLESVERIGGIGLCIVSGGFPKRELFSEDVFGKSSPNS